MRRAFLIGQHIQHSLSPAMYNAAFASRGQEISYELFDLPAAELEHGFARLRQPDCLGGNVTMPYKRAAALAADVRSDEVQRSAAANLLVRSGSKLLAYNTDVDALAASLRRRRRSVEAGSALLIGAGGAAGAVLEAFREVTPRAVVLAARRREASRRLVIMRGLLVPGFCPKMKMASALSKSSRSTVPFPTPIDCGRPTLVAS